MSKLVNEQVEFFKVKAPETALKSGLDYGVLCGGNGVLYKDYSSNSHSNSSTTFSFNPPSNTITSRKMMIKVPVTIDFLGVATPGAGLLQSGYDAFRAFPVSSIIKSLIVKINNSNFNIDLSEVIHPLAHIHSDEELMKFNWSTTPVALDNFQSYSEAVNTVNNVLNSTNESLPGAIPPRGAFVVKTVTNVAGDTTAQVTADLCEYLMLPPLEWGVKDGKGFVYVDSIDITINWETDLARVWSHAAGNHTVNSVTTTLESSPSLLIKYIEPSIVEPLPKVISYPFCNVQRYTNEVSTQMLLNDSLTLSSRNIEFQSMPSSIIVFARRRPSTKSFTTTDTFLRLSQVSCIINSRSGLLANADPRQLYEISVRNGLKMGWSDWYGQSVYLQGSDITTLSGAGSILVINPVLDFGLPPNKTTGSLSRTSFTVSVTAQNIGPTLSGFELVVIAQYAGIFSIDDTRYAVKEQGIIRAKDIEDAKLKSMPEYNYHELQGQFMFGGANIFQRAKEYIAPKLKQVAEFGKEKILPLVRAALKDLLPKMIPLFLSALGSREVEAKSDEEPSYGPRIVNRGGKYISRADLRKLQR